MCFARPASSRPCRGRCRSEGIKKDRAQSAEAHARITQRKNHRAAALAAFARRARDLAGAARFDLALVHCELFPYLPALFERWLAVRRIPYVLDFDDAIFHYYDEHRSPLVRALLGNKMRAVLARAARVFAGSRYLADYALAVNSRVDVVPTVVDLELYPRERPTAPTPARPFTVGWIGVTLDRALPRIDRARVA